MAHADDMLKMLSDANEDLACSANLARRVLADMTSSATKQYDRLLKEVATELNPKSWTATFGVF